MTQNELPAPWGDGATESSDSFNLESAIDGAVAFEFRRRRSGDIIESAHQESQKLVAAKFEELIRLSLPESLLKALDYSILPSHTIWGCSCKLHYLGQSIYLGRPANSLSDWRLMSDVFPSECCSSSGLGQMLMLYLAHIRKAVGSVRPDERSDAEGEDYDEIGGGSY
ncbi:MAG: hypothetical protein SAJ12_07325 [Jaaginema sp. PMC 1079.18]|nr:hypothetical protein [Jaaginema sp. PMC 1080.18]MEC4850808.1 hypothetical protein [Jaaginema sp. PMC 1079.18]MEC4868179.1 hypothetical protein [Jaaginema sp. PMC 1078.18]